MKRLANIAFLLGSLAMLAALVAKAAYWQHAGILFLCGSVASAAGRMANRKSAANIVKLRLQNQQVLASLLFIVTGGLMTALPSNEWIGCLCIATVFEFYSAFRISAIEKRESRDLDKQMQEE